MLNNIWNVQQRLPDKHKFGPRKLGKLLSYEVLLNVVLNNQILFAR
jgi:hypothetical protein